MRNTSIVQFEEKIVLVTPGEESVNVPLLRHVLLIQILYFKHFDFAKSLETCEFLAIRE